MIDENILYKVAIDYYVKKKLQREIAKELDISSVQVSKYLKKAKERGIVKIKVVPPELTNNEKSKYETLFKDIFNIDRVIVTSSYTNPNRLLISLCEEAKKYIKNTFPNEEMNVGIGWGTTMTTLSELSEFPERSHWNIVPLSGGSSKISDKHFNINRIVHNFANKLNATPNLIYLPFLLKDEISKKF